MIPTMMTYSKACDWATLKHWSLKQLMGSTGIIFGEHIMRRRISFTHSFCESVKSADPYLFLICSLNLSTMTETNRFMMKKVTMKMYMT